MCLIFHQADSIFQNTNYKILTIYNRGLQPHIPTVTKILSKTASSEKSSLSNYGDCQVLTVFFKTYWVSCTSDRKNFWIFSSLIIKNIKLSIILYFILSDTDSKSCIYYCFCCNYGENQLWIMYVKKTLEKDIKLKRICIII